MIQQVTFQSKVGVRESDFYPFGAELTNFLGKPLIEFHSFLLGSLHIHNVMLHDWFQGSIMHMWPRVVKNVFMPLNPKNASLQPLKWRIWSTFHHIKNLRQGILSVLGCILMEKSVKTYTASLHENPLWPMLYLKRHINLPKRCRWLLTFSSKTYPYGPRDDKITIIQ